MPSVYDESLEGVFDLGLLEIDCFFGLSGFWSMLASMADTENFSFFPSLEVLV